MTDEEREGEASIKTKDKPHDKAIAMTTSPLWHFIREHCEKCPCRNVCGFNQQLTCILAGIALDLRALIRDEVRRVRSKSF